MASMQCASAVGRDAEVIYTYRAFCLLHSAKTPICRTSATCRGMNDHTLAPKVIGETPDTRAHYGDEARDYADRCHDVSPSARMRDDLVLRLGRPG
jgi:hypothetical protein